MECSGGIGVIGGSRRKALIELAWIPNSRTQEGSQVIWNVKKGGGVLAGGWSLTATEDEG